MSSEQLGPAWTREPNKNKGKRSSKPNKSAEQPSSSSPFYSTSNSASSSSLLDLPRPQPPQEAPYLTHIVRHHGHLTLIAPDNHGARRLPGTEDAKEAEGTATGKVKKKKKVKRTGPDPAILSAVYNVGKSPSTPPAAGSDRRTSRDEQRPSSSGSAAARGVGMSRSRSGISLLNAPEERRRLASVEAAQSRQDAAQAIQRSSCPVAERKKIALTLLLEI
jgi:hypothetical protein